MAKRVAPVPPKQAKYASCPNDGRILEYYKGQFDSVFILLHPFLLPKTIDMSRFCPEKWPGKHEIIEGCEAVSWARVLELTSLDSLSDIDIGLRTCIGGVQGDLANRSYADILDKLTEESNVIHPMEGALPPLLENLIYESIKVLGHEYLWVGDEWGTERKLHWIEDLIEKAEVLGSRCVFSHDHRLLVTTHWDSHCSFLCSSKEIIEQILDVNKFEGFYCTEKTEVYWGFNDI